MSKELPQITPKQQKDVSTLTTISNTASMEETYNAIKESIETLCEEIKNTATGDTVYFEKDRVLEEVDAGYRILLDATYRVSPEQIQEVKGVEQIMEIINKSSSGTNELSEDIMEIINKSSSGTNELSEDEKKVKMVKMVIDATNIIYMRGTYNAIINSILADCTVYKGKTNTTNAELLCFEKVEVLEAVDVGYNTLHETIGGESQEVVDDVLGGVDEIVEEKMSDVMKELDIYSREYGSLSLAPNGRIWRYTDGMTRTLFGTIAESINDKGNKRWNGTSVIRKVNKKRVTIGGMYRPKKHKRSRKHPK